MGRETKEERMSHLGFGTCPQLLGHAPGFLRAAPVGGNRRGGGVGGDWGNPPKAGQSPRSA
jgi:hypothetical protein